jgi:hypothetical protein
MVQCQIQTATRYAFPKGPASVEDRRMSLDSVCREGATYSVQLRSTSGGKTRQGAVPKEFLVCENHSQLVSQVDRELTEDGWASALGERPKFLA